MRDRYERQRRQFVEETQEHEMHVLHEDGPYRHLRFQKPGTGNFYWDLITWPGSLAIRGDIGEGHIFTRIDDMLQFFDNRKAEHEINAGYWAEKLDWGHEAVKEFSTELFVEWLTDYKHVPADVLDGAWDVGYTEHAIEFVQELGLAWDSEDPRLWEDFGHHFILALHAILWGAKRYHESKAQA